MDNCHIDKKEESIASMFDSIASRYDLLCHILSFNIDKPWRKKFIKIVKKTGATNTLDLACGTGDISIGLFEKGVSVVGMDISEKMLKEAQTKLEDLLSKNNFSKSEHQTINFQYGSAEMIPAEENSFDAVTISFGIRNFDNRDVCLKEIYRVLKPNGKLAIMEFTIPKNTIWKTIYSFYFRNILPKIGALLTNQKFAYSYLPASAFTFPQREAFCKEIEEGGFKNTSFKSLTGGVACIYIGEK